MCCSDFFKSTRKIIAASRSTYEKLVGVSAGEELSQMDNEVTILEQPQKRRKTTCEGDTSLKVLSIDNKLDEIDKKLSFIEELRKAFECIICQSSAKPPMVTVCCQSVIGCKECVERWCLTNTHCPLCSVTGRMTESFCLKGFHDLLGVSDRHTVPATSSPVTDLEAASDDSANEFEEMPAFQVPCAPRSD